MGQQTAQQYLVVVVDNAGDLRAMQYIVLYLIYQRLRTRSVAAAINIAAAREPAMQ